MQQTWEGQFNPVQDRACFRLNLTVSIDSILCSHNEEIPCPVKQVVETVWSVSLIGINWLPAEGGVAQGAAEDA